MYFIDLHTHVYPEDIAEKATQSVKDFYGIGEGDMDGTPRRLLETGKAAGISKFVILPVAIRPDRAPGINRFIADQVAQHPEFVGFGTVHAGMEGLMAEVEHITRLGLKGIKMHPDSQRFAIDDPRLFPMYEEVQGKLPVLLHMGDHRYDYSHPARLRRVLELFPRLQAIAAHFGGYSVYEIAMEELGHTDCIMDTSSSLMFLPEGVAERYIRTYGTERMAFGTDYPMWDPREEMARFLKLKLTPAEQEQIAHKTARRILGI